jgi:hypothetical protein
MLWKLKMLEIAFREQRLGRTQVSEWFFKFKSYVTDVKDSDCSGCPFTGKTGEDVEQVKELVLETEDKQSIKLLIYLEFHLGQFRAFEGQSEHVSGCHQIHGPLPHPFPVSEEHKEKHVNIFQDVQERHERFPEFLLNVITGDETWLYRHDPENK